MDLIQGCIRLNLLCYTGAHEGDKPETISYALRRCSGGSLAPAGDRAGGHEVQTVCEISLCTAGTSGCGSLSISRVHRGMERMGR